jgi:hypothetical protein
MVIKNLGYQLYFMARFTLTDSVIPVMSQPVPVYRGIS